MHKYVKLTEVNTEFSDMPQEDSLDDPFNYMIEVYMYDYIVLAIPRIRNQLPHVANAVMTGIHYVFPTDKDDDEHAISLNFFEKGGRWGSY